MCGRAYDPRFLFLWPNARTSVMGAQQAAHVLLTVKQQQRARDKAPLPEDVQRRIQDSTVAQYEREGSAYFSTARLWDDGIIDPAETRSILGLCLDIAMAMPVRRSHPPVFRM
jgi:3-methylcrotonyl-CoA carboxylase beta subunit